MATTDIVTHPSLVEALVLARETLSGTIGRIYLDYDWIGDPEQMQARQADTFAAIDAALIGSTAALAGGGEGGT